MTGEDLAIVLLLLVAIGLVGTIARMAVVVECAPRTDGRLSLVRVEPGAVVTSEGEVLLVRYDKLLHLAEQICQEGAAVCLRVWAGRDGVELVELYRVPRWAAPRPVPRREATDPF